MRSRRSSAMILVDMIGDRNLTHPPRRRLDAVAHRHHLGGSASASATVASSSNEDTRVEDDHVPFLEAGVPVGGHHRPRLSRTGTPPTTTLDHVSARSLQIVGDVVLAALPDIERRLTSGR